MHKFFRTQACAGCHAIRGTQAHGTVGPDLTHLGSRLTLGALTLPNTPSGAARVDRRSAAREARREDARAPAEPGQLNAVTAYLESLR